METFTWPTAGLNPDEAINGQYGPAIQPSVVQAAGSDSTSPMGVASIPNWSAVLLWWFALLGLAVGMHVLFLRFNE